MEYHQICAVNYEIVAARNLINSLFNKSDGPRLPKRTRQDKADKAHVTVDDIVKVVLNPNKQLPQIYAVNLTRLPLVAPTHCDIITSAG